MKKHLLFVIAILKIGQVFAAEAPMLIDQQEEKISADEQEQKIVCQYCQQKFKLENNLKMHLAIKHKPKKQTIDIPDFHVQCLACGFICHESNIAKHEAKHSYLDTQYKCFECEAGMNGVLSGQPCYFETELGLMKHLEACHLD